MVMHGHRCGPCNAIVLCIELRNRYRRANGGRRGLLHFEIYLKKGHIRVKCKSKSIKSNFYAS